MKSKKLVLVIATLFLLTIPCVALAADKTLANFEDGIQGWIADEDGAPEWGEGAFTLEKGDIAFAGSGSLKVNLKGDSTKYKIVSSPEVLATVQSGKTYTFHVYIPSDSGISAVQPYIQFKEDWSGWKDLYVPVDQLKLDDWNTIEYEIPADATEPYKAFGLLIITNEAKPGVVYIDSVDDGSGSITEDATEDEPAPAENPKTGDNGLLLLLAMAGASASVIACRKKSK